MLNRFVSNADTKISVIQIYTLIVFIQFIKLNKRRLIFNTIQVNEYFFEKEIVLYI
jgi:hypothetical protein